ncbi:hypothetical protein D9M69_698830 [compost metagenome]
MVWSTFSAAISLSTPSISARSPSAGAVRPSLARMRSSKALGNTVLYDSSAATAISWSPISGKSACARQNRFQ